MEIADYCFYNYVINTLFLIVQNDANYQVIGNILAGTKCVGQILWDIVERYISRYGDCGDIIHVSGYFRQKNLTSQGLGWGYLNLVVCFLR